MNVCWLRRRSPALRQCPHVPLRLAAAPLGWLADAFGRFCRIHGVCADDCWNGSGVGGHLPAGPGRSPVNCTPWNSSNYIVIVCFFWSPPGFGSAGMPLRLCHRCSNNFVCVAYGGGGECLLAEAPLARAASGPNVPLRSTTAPLGWLADGFGWFCRMHGFCADDGWNGSGAGGRSPAGPGRLPVFW